MTDEQFDTAHWYQAFARWMERVDRALLKRSGLSSADLAGQPFADWYEDGVTPAEAARLTLTDEGFPEE